MSNLVNKAASITPPVKGKNLWVLASSATTQKIEVPASWYKNQITFQADGVDFYIVFGEESTLDVDQAAASTVTSEAFASFEGSEGWKVPSGQEVTVDMTMVAMEATENASPSSKKFYFAVDALATGGWLRILRSSGRVTP